MAGLLGDVLPYIYSRGNALKRQLGGLLSDPVGSAQQSLGLLVDKDREQQGLLAQAFANQREPFRVTDKAALGRAAENMLTGPLGVAPVGITAWHGSPHKFDRFDSSKIGTGEGAQAYGHGLYLAESPGVAKQYADNLSDVTKLTPEGRAAKALAEANGNTLAAKQALWREYNQSAGTPYADAAFNAVQALERGGVKAPNLYKVDLPDEAVARMLDWDKPLSQQSPKVQKAVAAAGYTPHPEQLLGDFIRSRSGNGFAEYLADDLRKAGIPGVRYLDGGSRGAGAGTRNFVVFPGEESLLTVLERNGVPIR